MPTWIAIVILGIIEGITEFLPISSTAHLLIAQNWLPRQSDLFNIVIQSGAVIAVLPLFPERMHQFVFQWRERATQDYALKIAAAFVITAVGVAFVAIEMGLRGRPLSDTVTWPIVVAVGLGQLVAAIFPGASRSGTTILALLLLGLSRPAATEFSFLVGIPTMLAAGGLKIFKALRHPLPGAPAEDWGLLLLGFSVSALVSFVAVKWLLTYVRSHTFTIFGWYRIALGGVLFGMLFFA
jgi:undecaprenyl-diphosphatase